MIYSIINVWSARLGGGRPAAGPCTAHIIGFKETPAWSGLRVGLALILGAVVFLVLGATAGTEYTKRL